MISLPASIYEPWQGLRERLALFIGAQRADLYHWRGGALAPARGFEATDAGREDFRRCLEETGASPCYILVDVFEEEYRLEAVPRVSRRDRRAVLQRRARRLFRNTPYYFHQLLGRTGRTEDQVLLTAITRPDVVRRWTSILEETKTPLACIYSLPLFTGALLKLLGAPAAHQLVLSLQSVSGLRQSFFHNGRLRLSRLARMPVYGSESYAPHIHSALEKTCRGLDELRLVTPQAPLHVYFLLGGELQRELRNEYQRQESIICHFCDLDETAARLGFTPATPAPFSDLFFIQQLLARRPVNCYAGAAEMRYFSMRRLRGLAAGAGVLALLGSAGWSGAELWRGLSLKRQAAAAAAQAQHYAARIEQAREQLPDLPAAPADLKAAVDIAGLLARYKSSPLAAAQLLSKGLERFPNIRVNRLTWSVAADPARVAAPATAAAPGRAAASPAAGPAAAVSPGRGWAVSHVALLEGVIDPFDGDFRAAIALVKRFADVLRKQTPAPRVEILSLPLDLGSGAALQGDSRAAPDQAQFALRLATAHDLGT